MRITGRPKTVRIGGAEFSVRRTTGGVAEIQADDDESLARGIGFVHAHDRLVQMMLMRLLGQGRLSECLQANDQSLSADVAMRQLGFARAAHAEVDSCSPEARRVGQAYCAGVNEYVRRHRLPLEFRLAKYRPEPWMLADILLTIHLMSYAGQAEIQQQLEKFLIQSIHAGCPLERLQQLFAPHLDGLDREAAGLIRRVKIFESLLPQSVGGVPGGTASNNWALAGRRSVSGRPIQCNDPHMEVHRLPSVWYELVTYIRDDCRIGATVPGIPGIVMGRTRRISFGLTYGMMDQSDYFIEECRDGRCRRGNQHVPLMVREEVVKRKGRAPVRATVFESELGVLETDPYQAKIEDGFYLCHAYSGRDSGAARSFNALAMLPTARTVPDVQRIVRDAAVSGNWVIADCDGNIGYQQSGILPARKHSGLYPLPAWDSKNTWAGQVPPEQLSHLFNPESGVVVTANDDWNQPGGPLSINASGGPYRAERIQELLQERDVYSAEDMECIQTDLLSTQARRFMTVLRPFIPDTPTGRILAEWDLRYAPDSQGATLFEVVYHRLMEETFGAQLFGRQAWREIVSSTPIFTLYHAHFDRGVLGNEPWWFGEAGRENVIRRAIAEATSAPPETIPRWGERQRLMMENLFLGRLLPRFLGSLLRINHGPVPLVGSRATVVQGAEFRARGELKTIGPGWRMIADLAHQSARTALAGGPSGRVLSRWYKADLDRWLTGRYKLLGGP